MIQWEAKGEMYYVSKKLQEDIRCPLEYGLEVFGGKWKSRIICALAEMQTLRYSEIRKQILLFQFFRVFANGLEFFTTAYYSKKVSGQNEICPDTFYTFWALYSSPQFHIASKIGLRLLPNSVRLYSTRGGTSA